MSDRPTYVCGTCGDRRLILTPAVEHSLGAGGWRVTCGNGHVIAPTPGTVITILCEGEPDEV